MPNNISIVPAMQSYQPAQRNRQGGLNDYLGNHVAALKVSSERNAMIANNLANADTPNFKARDIDFRQALDAAGGGSTSNSSIKMTVTHAGQIDESGATANGIPEAKYRVPLAPSLDGNTVDVQLEQTAFAANAVRYQTSLTFLSAKFRNLMTAITGQ